MIKHTWQFRGDRNYIQAASIFDCIVSLRQTQGLHVSAVDFSMRKFTSKQCALLLQDEPVNDADIVGEYKDSNGFLTIIEQPEVILERTAYDESTLVTQCVINENRINIPGKILSYSFIEKVIAAYKALLQNLFGKKNNFFFFIRLTLDQISSGEIQVIYERLVSKKYYQGSIFANNTKIGMIYFGVNKI